MEAPPAIDARRIGARRPSRERISTNPSASLATLSRTSPRSGGCSPRAKSRTVSCCAQQPNCGAEQPARNTEFRHARQASTCLVGCSRSEVVVTRTPTRSSDCSVTRDMGFSWDKGMDWLWRERVELIGDQRGDEMGESIEHGTVLGQSEGRELLDVTDDGLDDATPIEQSLV